MFRVFQSITNILVVAKVKIPTTICVAGQSSRIKALFRGICRLRMGEWSNVSLVLCGNIMMSRHQRLIPPTVGVFVQQFVQSDTKVNIKARVTGHLWGESTGDRCWPVTRKTFQFHYVILMKTLPPLLAHFMENPRVTGGLSSQMGRWCITLIFSFFVDLNKLLNKK